MGFFISRRLPGGFRAGLSIPVGQQTRRTLATAASTASAPMADAAWCYVIRGAHGLVKIGVTTSVQARLATLKTSSPYALEVTHTYLVTDGAARAVEAEAHRLLDKNRCAGEWFDVTANEASAAVEKAAQTISGKAVIDTTKTGLVSPLSPLPTIAGKMDTIVERVAMVALKLLIIGLAIIILLGILGWYMASRSTP